MTTFERMKNLCKDRKISINDLENSLGYSKNTLYRLKTQTPGADKLEVIADYFDVSVDYLLGRTDEKRNFDSTVSGNNTDTDTRTLQRAINKMSPEEKKKAIAVLGAVFDGLFDDEDYI